MKQLTDGTNSIIKWEGGLSIDNEYIEATNIHAMALIFIDDAHAVLDGGFSIDELEQIISKMKELQEHKNAHRI